MNLNFIGCRCGCRCGGVEETKQEEEERRKDNCEEKKYDNVIVINELYIFGQTTS